jgi:hypothetical protein
MRGEQERSGSLFSYVSIEERIPASHPLRRIRQQADPLHYDPRALASTPPFLPGGLLNKLTAGRSTKPGIARP